MVSMNRTAQLALNVQILNSEGTSGMETDVGAAGMSVDEIVEGGEAGRNGKKAWHGEWGIDRRRQGRYREEP